ncbi:MAG: response regulator [Elusimicrobiota bacterium]
MSKGEFGERVFTTFQVARLCGVFHTTVINWANKGKLGARVTPGGHRRIPLSELKLFMKKYEMPIPADIEDTHKRILILDDERVVTRWLERGFSKHKDRYAVQIANNPVDALVIVGKKQPDLLVLDLLMPGMDGFEVCRILKANPATKEMKIVAISGKKLAASHLKFLEENADCLLCKPFSLGEIIGQIDRLLS